LYGLFFKTRCRNYFSNFQPVFKIGKFKKLTNLGNISQNGLKGFISVSDCTPVVDHEDGEPKLEEDLGPELEVGGAHIVRAALKDNDQRNVAAGEGHRLSVDSAESILALTGLEKSSKIFFFVKKLRKSLHKHFKLKWIYDDTLNEQ
jgi:hypothetical protein